MSEQKIHGYLTKYALTAGIRECTAGPGTGGYVYIKERYGSTQAKLGVSFFASRDAAEAAARKMALRKIVSLEKQITKLHVLAGTPKWGKKRTAPESGSEEKEE